jgi:hypothetical protein
VTYTDDHYYLTWGGSFGSVETWQTGLRFCPTPATPIANANVLLSQFDAISMPDILTALNAVIQSTTITFGSKVSLQWAKLAVIKEDGLYAGDPKLQEQAPVYGKGNSAMPYPQLAWAVSLWSGQNFGRANHGKMYWPVPTNATPDAVTGVVTPQICGWFQDLIYTAVSAINGEIATVIVDVRPCIMSKLGSGTTKVVSKIGVGGAVDTIRSRREALNDVVAAYKTGWSW